MTDDFINLPRSIICQWVDRLGRGKLHPRHLAHLWLIVSADDQGKVVRSTRYLARAWGVPHGTARRWLSLMSVEGKITLNIVHEKNTEESTLPGTTAGTDQSTPLTEVTICDYGRYSPGAISTGAVPGTLPSAEPITPVSTPKNASPKSKKKPPPDKRTDESVEQDMLKMFREKKEILAKDYPHMDLKAAARNFMDYWLARDLKTGTPRWHQHTHWYRTFQVFCEQPWAKDRYGKTPPNSQNGHEPVGDLPWI